MELTIEQALQRGVAAHREGKLQDAERLYRAILQSQPAHPDANHNLGVLAVSVNKAEAALPLFKTALEANPKMEQFWLSYIDALIKIEKVDDARRVLSDAQQAGVTAAKLQIFEEQLEFELSPRSHIPQQEISNPLHSHQGALSAAIELREVGKYKEAQEWLSNVIEHDSRNTEALSLLSQVLLLDKKEAEAEKALTAAASINSELPSVYRNQARLLLKQSKTAEALEKAQLGCRQSPEDSESLLVLAACLGANQRDLEALPLIEKILKAESNYAEAYANRALIKLRAKDTFGAIKDAEMTVSLKPHLTQMWQLLSSLHYQANNLSDAIEALRRAHKNEPENPDFMVQLGEFLRQDNKASEAITILEKATELAPKDANAWTNLGVVFQQEKRMADAKIAYEKALALNPKSAAIASNLGAMAKEAEEWESALQYFGKALEIEPNLAEAHSNLGGTLQELGRLDEAEASLRQAIGFKPDFAEPHNNLGNTLKQLGRLDEALASYSQAIALKPDYAELHNSLGATLQELGRLDEAEASFTQAIALKPDFAEAHRNLATMKKFEAQDEQYSKMLELYLNEDISEEQRCHINFGLAKACDDLGNFEQAYTHYGEGNVLRKKLLNYDINNDVKLFRKIKSNYPQIVKNSLASEKFPKNLMPIFIVGMPRSGTTLVEQIISSHSQVTGAGELNFAKQFGAAIATGITEVNNESLFDFRGEYLDKLQDVSNGNLIITDKMPQNFRFIGLLAAAFPEAKIIHVKRNPAAVCWANYKQYFVSKSIGYCYALDDVISYHKLYENLMEFWANTLSNRIYKLDYEQLTVNQESETRQLIDYLGLDWDENCLSPQNNTRSVATASNVQVRKKVYRGSSEQWKKYQPFLNGAFDELLSQ